LIPVTDYTASNGTSIVLTTGATLNDELMFVVWNTVSVANALVPADIGVTVAGLNQAVAFTTLSASGDVTLGDASTDTVKVNGYMGVGGAGNSAYATYIQSTALVGTGVVGVGSAPVAPVTATSSVYGYLARPTTTAASFTVTDVVGYNVSSITRGAGSTITNLHGVRVQDQVEGTNNYGISSAVSAGTNKWNIYASGTASNLFAGTTIIGTAAIATTATAGFLWIPSCAGAPTGAPTAPYTNAAALVADTTNSRLYVRIGSTWKYAALS
jgi:hypothetical protein